MLVGRFWGLSFDIYGCLEKIETSYKRQSKI